MHLFLCFSNWIDEYKAILFVFLQFGSPDAPVHDVYALLHACVAFQRMPLLYTWDYRLR